MGDLDFGIWKLDVRAPEERGGVCPEQLKIDFPCG